MFRCIYGLTEQARSDGEHILQNFLGARWRSHKIVSDDLQRAFGSGIDADFEKSLQVIRNYLGTPSGRGGEGPTLKGLATADQQKVNLLPGGKVQMAAPVITESESAEEQKQVRIKAQTREQITWALAQIKAKYPNTSVDEETLLASATVTAGYIDSSVTHELYLGGPELFRGLLKACFNLLGVNHPEIALLPCFNGVREYVREGVGGAAPYIRWYASEHLPNLPRLGPVDQHIFILCRGSSVEGVAQLFGGLVFPFQLTDSYKGPAFTCGYVVDPFRESKPAEQRNPAFEAVAVPVFSQQQDELNEEVLEFLRMRVEKTIELHLTRARNAEIKLSLEEAMAAQGAEAITDAVVKDFSGRMAMRALRMERNLGPYKKRGE